MIQTLFALPKTHQRMQEGPLGRYVSDYAALLHEQGYSPQSSPRKISLIADWSRWLQTQGIEARGLNSKDVEQYLQHRYKRLPPRRGDRSTLQQFLDRLRQWGICPSEKSAVRKTPLQREVEAFGRYLSQERGLCAATLKNNFSFVRQFLAERFSQGPIRFAYLKATDITDHVQRHAPLLSQGRKQLLLTALRAFLRYLRHRGAIATDLAACVPAVANWKLSSLPRFIPMAQIEKVLRTCDRSTPVGRRNYAILLLLARLGLRAGEIVHLTLKDLHWETGELTVRGKAGRITRLPMPQDVGRAIATYLKKDRPLCSLRSVFIRLKAPRQDLGHSNTVSKIARRALNKANVDAPRKGAHLFRHSLATAMLHRGASLAEIGQLLRHQHINTTAIYAKVDITALRPLARKWPLGGAR